MTYSRHSSDGQPRPPFGPPSGQDLSPVFRPHPLSKAVVPFSFQVRWLSERERHPETPPAQFYSGKSVIIGALSQSVNRVRPSPILGRFCSCATILPHDARPSLAVPTVRVTELATDTGLSCPAPSGIELAAYSASLNGLQVSLAASGEARLEWKEVRPR